MAPSPQAGFLLSPGLPEPIVDMLTEPFGVAAAARVTVMLTLSPSFASCGRYIHHTYQCTKPRNFAVRRLLPAGNAGAGHLVIEPVLPYTHAVRAAHDTDAGIRLRHTAALLIDGDYPILCTYLQTMRKEAEQCVR